MNESHDIHECVMSHIWIRHASCHSYEYIIPRTMSHISCRWVTSLPRMSHVTHMNTPCVMSHMWIHHTTNHVTHIVQVSHMTYTNESCHTYEYAMRHVTHVNTSYHEPSLTRMSHITHMNTSYHREHELRSALLAISRGNPPLSLPTHIEREGWVGGRRGRR